MQRSLVLLGIALLGLAAASCSRHPSTAPEARVARSEAGTGRSESGAMRSHFRVFTAACDIASTVDEFRAALGELNANLPGSRPGGRREINWDGVPAGATNTDDFPGDFFNQAVAGRARGVVFSTPGTGFRVSDVDFADVNPAYGEQFQFFSPVRTFTAVGSAVTNVDFFVPGSDAPATSAGFGVVFADVDRNGSASIRLFDANGKNLGRYAAPGCPGGLSFVGVTFPEAVIARVEITSGQGALGPDASDVSDRSRAPAFDLVIMDDFLFGEPTGSSGPVAGRADR